MTYQVTDDELRHIPGCTPLKIYIVLNNSPNGATAAMLANQLQCPRSSLFYGLSQVQKLGLLSKNGDIYSNILDNSPRFGKEKEKNQKKEENLKEKYYSSTTSNNREEVLFEWLTADAEFVHLLCKLVELVPEGGDTYEAEIEALRPFIHRFFEWLKVKHVNLEKKGAADCQDHFVSWLPSQVRRAKAAAATKAVPPLPQRSHGAQPTLTKEQQAEQLLQKRRRLEKSAELQRHLEEQNKAAEDGTQSEGYKNIMARFGLNKRKG